MYLFILKDSYRTLYKRQAHCNVCFFYSHTNEINRNTFSHKNTESVTNQEIIAFPSFPSSSSSRNIFSEQRPVSILPGSPAAVALTILSTLCIVDIMVSQDADVLRQAGGLAWPVHSLLLVCRVPLMVS